MQFSRVFKYNLQIIKSQQIDLKQSPPKYLLTKPGGQIKAGFSQKSEVENFTSPITNHNVRASYFHPESCF